MLRITPSNVYLIEILKPIAYMFIDNYIQWASEDPGKRFYVKRGAAGYISISSKNVTILAQKINYYEF